MVRNTRANVVELLKARKENLYACARATTNPETAKHYRCEAMGLDAAISYLTDKEYFQDIWNIFMGE